MNGERSGLARQICDHLGSWEPGQQLAIATQKLAQACGVDRCGFFAFDEETGRVEPVTSQFATGEESEAMWAAFTGLRGLTLEALPFFTALIERRSPIEIEDAATDPLIPRGWVELFEIKSALVVPIFRKDRVAGACVLDYRRERHRFTPDQTTLAMTLAGQVFPIMGKIASHEQVADIFKTAKKYLKDPAYGGFRLNTDFHEIRLDLGRTFSFAYGEKENGSFFSHMTVMFAYALYRRGFVKEGHEVLESIYRMAANTENSRIYPGIPEYFNSEGRGLYHYLTGSASWYILTLLTQVFGVRGLYGDLLLQPKLTKEQFGSKGETSVETTFAGKALTIIYKNSKKIPYEHTCISQVTINDQPLKEVTLQKKEVLIPRELLLKTARKLKNTITVTLE